MLFCGRRTVGEGSALESIKRRSLSLRLTSHVTIAVWRAGSYGCMPCWAIANHDRRVRSIHSFALPTSECRKGVAILFSYSEKGNNRKTANQETSDHHRNTMRAIPKPAEGHSFQYLTTISTSSASTASKVAGAEVWMVYVLQPLVSRRRRRQGHD